MTTTTTTTTTTICPILDCDCGSIFIPIGSKHSSSGLFLVVNYLEYDNNIIKSINLPLVHNQSFTLSNGYKFVTTTDKIKLDKVLSIQNIELTSENEFIRQNIISFYIKIHNSNISLFYDSIGKNKTCIFNNKILLNNTKCSNLINLNNQKLELMINSICYRSECEGQCFDYSEYVTTRDPHTSTSTSTSTSTTAEP